MRFIPFSLMIATAFVISPTVAQQAQPVMATDAQVDEAYAAAEKRCGKDPDCRVQLIATMSNRFGVQATCTRIAANIAVAKMQLARGELEGKKVTADERQEAEKVLVDVESKCQTSKGEVNALTIDALGKVQSKN